MVFSSRMGKWSATSALNEFWTLLCFYKSFYVYSAAFELNGRSFLSLSAPYFDHLLIELANFLAKDLA